MQELNSTAQKILDVAEFYTQTRGFNDFSYRDIQNEVGIKTSSIHYYFPTKQDLAISMTERYVEHFRGLLNNITQQQSQGLDQVKTLSQAYVDAVSKGKFCMCGMLASDLLSLPEEANNKLCEFFRLVEEWLAEAITLGKQQNDFKSSINPDSAASHFLASLEGGMLIARSQKRPEYLEAVVREALKQLQNE